MYISHTKNQPSIKPLRPSNQPKHTVPTPKTRQTGGLSGLNSAKSATTVKHIRKPYVNPLQIPFQTPPTRKGTPGHTPPRPFLFHLSKESCKNPSKDPSSTRIWMHPAGISSNISPYGLPTAPNVYICPMLPRATALCFLPSSVPQVAGAQLPPSAPDALCLAYAAQPHLVPSPKPAGCSPELCSVAAREYILSIGRTVLPVSSLAGKTQFPPLRERAHRG